MALSMVSETKIGLGLITCDRPEGCQKALGSLPWSRLLSVVLVNDGPAETLAKANIESAWPLQIIQNESRLGVGRSKNRAIKKLLASGVDHFFLMEDDIFIKNPSVFDRYLEAARSTGIQHLNFSQHGLKNKNAKGVSSPVAVVSYGNFQIALHRHCVGALSYYSRTCLEAVGLMDEEFYNGGEHLEHTYRIICAGFHPPFWFFADVYHSEDLLGDEPWSPVQSIIASRHRQSDLIDKSEIIFAARHGCTIGNIPVVQKREVLQCLEKIRRKFGGGCSQAKQAVIT